MFTNLRKVGCIFLIVIGSLVLIAGVFSLVSGMRDNYFLQCLIAALVMIGPAVYCLMYCFKKQEGTLPDELGEHDSEYFGCRGLCFNCQLGQENGKAYIDILYQNQFDTPTSATIRVDTPKKFLIVGKRLIEAKLFKIQCGPAEFGKTRQYVDVPEEAWGQEVQLNVQVWEIDFPKGNRVRFENHQVIPCPEISFNPKRFILNILERIEVISLHPRYAGYMDRALALLRTFPPRS